MIVLNIYYYGKQVKEFAKEMQARGILAQIRSNPGNLKYEYYFSADNPECLLLVDAWQDQAALDYHHQNPLMQEILALRLKYELRMEVMRFENLSELPASDLAYIKSAT